MLLKIDDSLLQLSLFSIDIVLQRHVEVLHGLEGQSLTLLTEDQLFVLEFGSTGRVQKLLFELIDIVKYLLGPFVGVQPDFAFDFVDEWLHDFL